MMPDQDVSYFRAVVDMSSDASAEEGQDAISVWNAAYGHQDGRFVIQPPAELFPASKESLVQLLELAEELKCEAAWVVLDKKHPKFMEQLRAFGYLGFVMTAPAGDAAHVLMRYDLE